MTTPPSGLIQVTLPKTQTVVELKYGNGALEIYSELSGLNTYEEIDDSLSVVKVLHSIDKTRPDNQVSQLPLSFSKAYRLWYFSMAKYAALVQNKPITFNEWSPSEWFAEVGGFLSFLELVAEASTPPSDPVSA